MDPETGICVTGDDGLVHWRSYGGYSAGYAPPHRMVAWKTLCTSFYTTYAWGRPGTYDGHRDPSMVTCLVCLSRGEE